MPVHAQARPEPWLSSLVALSLDVRGSLGKMKLIILARPVDQRALRIFLSLLSASTPVLGEQAHTSMPGFLCVC